MIVSHVHMAGDLKKKIADMKEILASDEIQQALDETSSEIDAIWRRSIYKYFNKTSQMPVMSYDEKTRVVNPMTLEVEWKETPRYVTRQTSGQLGRACRVNVSSGGRISISMAKLTQWTSQKKKWMGADYGEFLRKGIRPSLGAYDPPSGKRMILSDDDGMVYWACGVHPGFTNEKWLRFMDEFKTQYKTVVVMNMRKAILEVMRK